jgi:hypothetical protein
VDYVKRYRSLVALSPLGLLLAFGGWTPATPPSGTAKQRGSISVDVFPISGYLQAEAHQEVAK